MSELTITRQDLVEIATEALADTKGLTVEQEMDLCHTAHTMDSVLSGNWVTPECGCLVGTLFRNQFYADQVSKSSVHPRDVEDKLGRPILELGVNFDERLDRHFDHTLLADTVIRVIDEAA